MADAEVLTVSQLTREIKRLLEAGFAHVWVQGEVSNCTRAGSGHVYFTLKDDLAQLRAVMWRSSAARMMFEIHDGLQVIASGPIEVYAARGTYQLVVERLVPEGIGPLELAFRQLERKLAAEGLFDPERKRPIPRFPRTIALVTSPAGAAVRDMLQVITRRWNCCHIVIVPVSVQGETAAGEIAAALAMVHRIPGVDVAIVGRGGGSLEDLWSFNEEIVARAIAACQVPVISAVGHEIDVTIADLVADRRALTPSEAGEIAVPLASEVMAHLNHQKERISAALRERAGRARLRVNALSSRRIFARPMERIHQEANRLDDLAEDLRAAMLRLADRSRQRLAHLSGTIQALSPLRVLGRGYSITRRTKTGEVVRLAAQVQPGDELSTLVSRGTITSRVEHVDPVGGLQTDPTALVAAHVRLSSSEPASDNRTSDHDGAMP